MLFLSIFFTSPVRLESQSLVGISTSGDMDSESLARYHSLLATYAETGTLPDEMPVHQAETAVTVLNLIAEFRHRVLPHSSRILGRNTVSVEFLLFWKNVPGSEPVDSFGPRKLRF